MTMNRPVICLLLLFVVYAVGIVLFTKGFLLKRTVIDKNSTCSVSFSDHKDIQRGCWMPRQYDKVIIIIIDALRFDFAAYNSSIAQQNELPFQNKLKLFNELLTQKPQNTRLYHFTADPPTTTMQRLKGLTTGSLPTFVDAGSNFASTEITEDNFIDQLYALNKSMVFMGDDTWDGLFPRRFNRSYPFPSFNVQDLHTVDNGVIKNLVPEIKMKDWSLLVAHFLGVDHCGHRYGPYHPAMAEKLTQMDKVLRSVIQEMTSDTILFVMGDHGMTRTGDHGGDSDDEVDAALFVYSPTQITSVPPSKEHQTVSQIDLVPTLSLLLGSPIPHSNLGTAIPDLFNHCSGCKTENKIQEVLNLVKVLRLNAYQVKSYIKDYIRVSEDFTPEKLGHLDKLFIKADSDMHQLVTLIDKGEKDDVLEKLLGVQKIYLDYLNGVKVMCKDIWAKFDLPTMVLGLASLFAAVVWNILLQCKLISVDDKQLDIAILGTSLTLVYIFLIWWMDLQLIYVIIYLLVSILLIVILSMWIIWKRTKKSITIAAFLKKNSLSEYTCMAMTVIAIQCAGLFSDNYIINESTIMLLFTLLLICVQGFKMKQSMICDKNIKFENRRRTPKFQYKDIGRIMTSQTGILVIKLIFAVTVMFVSVYFQACREEQDNCEVSSFLQPLAALDVSAGYKNMRYLLSVLCIVICIAWILIQLNNYGNLRGYSGAILCGRYLLPLATLCICLHWALQSISPKVFDSLKPWQQVTLARIVFACVVLTIISLVIQPLCIYLVPRYGQTIFSGEQSIPTMYNHIKMNWRQHFISNDEKPPTVYGLATVYSAPFLMLIGSVAPLGAIVLGDGLSPSLCIALVSMVVFLDICSYERCDDNGNESQMNNTGVPFLTLVTWTSMSSYFFYASGHQTTVQGIRWDAAFHGIHGDFSNNVIPAILVHLNTFCPQIIFTIALPLLIIWPYVKGSKKQDGTKIIGKGEFLLHENATEFRVQMFKLINGFILIHGMKFFATMCCAALHKRHLMVWKIFAPRYVYEGASFLTVAIYSLLIFLFVLRIDTSLEKWVQKLERQSKTA